jgi:hypothetical protein
LPVSRRTSSPSCPATQSGLRELAFARAIFRSKRAAPGQLLTRALGSSCVSACPHFVLPVPLSRWSHHMPRCRTPQPNVGTEKSHTGYQRHRKFVRNSPPPHEERLGSWPSWISARVRSHSRKGPKRPVVHQITDATARPFLHLLIPARRPRRESRLSSWSQL